MAKILFPGQKAFSLRHDVNFTIWKEVSISREKEFEVFEIT